MKANEVLRNAARFVFEGRAKGGCGAVSLVEGPTFYNAEARYYFDMMKPVGSSFNAYWWPRGRRGRKERVLALLFAAAIAESEGN